MADGWQGEEMACGLLSFVPYLSALPCAASRSHRFPLTEALSCFVYFLLALITPATQRKLHARSHGD